MRSFARVLLPLFALLGVPRTLPAQMPFYTDDPAVTAPGAVHIEFFDQYDALRSSHFPDLRQNTANFTFDYGLPHGLEFDLDAPYLSIFRAASAPNSNGGGDFDTGLKWNFRNSSRARYLPVLSTSFYVEFPTGNVRKELGSGEHDYWLTFIAQQPLSPKTRMNLNLGFLFAGNTTTGVVGIQTTRGHVYVGGLSLLHDFSPKLTLGGEIYGGMGDQDSLGRSQLQALGGGQFALRDGLTLDFALLGGQYSASPRIGGLLGLSFDLPALWHRPGAGLAQAGRAPGIDELIPAPRRRTP